MILLCLCNQRLKRCIRQQKLKSVCAEKLKSPGSIKKISESEFVATNLQTTAVSAILFFVSKDVGYEFPFRILLPSSILPPVPLPSVVLSLSSTCPTVYKLVPSINQTDFVE